MAKQKTNSSKGRVFEDIAIIGIGCRFPGNVNNAAEFWQLLLKGINTTTTIPADRWDANAYFHPDKSRPGRMHVRHGSFLNQIDLFDADFFGFSPRETALMDPQQRLLLEVTWEALEDAGLPIGPLQGKAVGVFVGEFSLDHKLSLSSPLQFESDDSPLSTGIAATLLANRLSYWFDWEGPSIALDTACSSSLTAIHLACQSLWTGESCLALAGGVNLIFYPQWIISHCKGGFLSADGRSKAFDATADGYGRGEGCGMLVLKPLSAALADGDPIYCLISGSGVNHTGRTPGLSVPSTESQIALLQSVYKRADIEPAAVGYIEAHGTGTVAGDPVETAALGDFFGSSRENQKTCLLGSVKSNIGHLEAAAGVAGVIKGILCLQHDQVPPTLIFTEPNPAIDFAKLSLELVRETKRLPGLPGHPKYVGVNSFGFGGANAHLILKEAPKQKAEKAKQLQQPLKTDYQLLVLSAHNEAALKARASDFQKFLTTETPANLWSDICYSAANHRTHRPYRLAITARNSQEAAELLGSYVKKEPQKLVSYGKALVNETPKLVMVFSGMGPQWWGMGRQLLEISPIFRKTLERCDKIFSRHGNWSIMAELQKPEEQSRMAETQIAQIAGFAVQVGLFELWRSLGVTPAAIVGHSVGEVAAAYAAGILSLEDAVLVVHHRSRLLSELAGQGTMLAVGMSEQEGQTLLKDIPCGATIAAVNSPSDITLSGSKDGLQEITQKLNVRQIFNKLLQVEVPYHSQAVDAIKGQLAEALQPIQPQAAKIPFYSTVSGDKVEGPSLTPAYWADNARHPVKFKPAIEKLLGIGGNVFLEIGPHPVLSNFVTKTATSLGVNTRVFGTLRRYEDDAISLNNALALLHIAGYPLAWNNIYQPGRLVKLPAYPWQRSRHWFEAEGAIQERLVGPSDILGHTGPRHPLLGVRLQMAQLCWHNLFEPADQKILADHKTSAFSLLPAAYLAVALAEMAKTTWQQTSLSIESLDLKHMVLLDQPFYLHSHFHPEDGRGEFYSRPRHPTGSNWVNNAAGKISKAEEFNESVDLEHIRQICPEEVNGQDFYRQVRDLGLEYGPAFRCIEKIYRGENENLGLLRVEDWPDSEPFYQKEHENLKPVLILDACFQLLLGIDPFLYSFYLPQKISAVRINDLGLLAKQAVYGRAILKKVTPQEVIGRIQILDEKGQILVDIGELYCRAVPPDYSSLWPNLYKWDWVYLTGLQHLPTPAKTSRHYLVIAPTDSAHAQIAAQKLQQAGNEVVIATLPKLEIDSDKRAAAKAVLEKLPALPRSERWTLIYLATAEHPATLRLPSWPRREKPAQSDGGVVTSEQGEANDNPPSWAATHLEDLLFWAQAIGSVDWAENPVLWIVTNGAYVKGDEQPGWIALAQAPIWGFGRVLRHELPQIPVQLMDINQNPDDEEWDRCLSEIAINRGENEMIVQPPQSFGHRLTPVTPEKLPITSSTDKESRLAGLLLNKTYLITGGLSGLGLRTATWLASRGAKWLVLVSRNADRPSGEAKKIIQRLVNRGVRVQTIAADISKKAEVFSLPGKFAPDFPRLDGVIHAANVYQDALLEKMTPEQLRKSLEPKMFGSWWLHELTKDMDLNIFLLFSSISAVIGNPGQANYAAANAFLEALADLRIKQHLPAINLNLGAVRDTGYLAQNPKVQEMLATLGITPLSPSTIFQVIEALINNSLIFMNLTFAEVDWLKQSELKGDHCFDLCFNTAARSKVLAGIRQVTNEADAIAAVQKIVAKVMKIADPKTIDPDTNLFNLGMDSMMAMEVAVNMAQGTTLSQRPQATIFRTPTVRQLAQLLLKAQEPQAKTDEGRS